MVDSRWSWKSSIRKFFAWLLSIENIPEWKVAFSQNKFIMS